MYVDVYRGRVRTRVGERSVNRGRREKKRMRSHLQVEVEGVLSSDDGQGDPGDTPGYVSYGEGVVGMRGGRPGEERDGGEGKGVERTRVDEDILTGV